MGIVKSIEVHGITGTSTIRIGERLVNLKNYLPNTKGVIITDRNVCNYYQTDFPPYNIITIGGGEAVKTLDTVRDIYDKLMEYEADRSCFIVGIGGGIVCDIAGYVASTYLRGIRFAFVSTTLLSQVDASVGGKNGVNFRGYKNVIGTFNQPEFVICDIDLLKTLPEKEILCGLAETVKHAALGDADLFSYLEENFQKALSLDKDVIAKLVFDSVRLKASIVNRDELEAGERRKLNFGHTFGHAIEKTGHLPHGEAISIGMVAAVKLSVKKGLLPSSSGVRIENLLASLKLPTRLKADPQAVLDALKKDKKRAGETINFILLHEIGAAVVQEISIAELETIAKELL